MHSWVLTETEPRKWSDASYFRKIMDVNFFGVLQGISTFYDHFDNNKAENKAIVVTGSKQGITNPPYVALLSLMVRHH